MAIDVLHYPDLLRVERELFAFDSSFKNGHTTHGRDDSYSIGNGFEIDGIRDYQPGDDARHIDWFRTAMRDDEGLTIRRFFKDRCPITVLVSDIPTDNRYAETPGDPLSARTLGFVVAKQLIDVVSAKKSPAIGVWSHGFKTDSHSRIVSDPGIASLQIIKDGLSLAAESTALAEAKKNAGQKRRFLGSKVESVNLTDEIAFSDVINSAVNMSLRYSGAARFIIMSDFRSDTEDTFRLMKKINNKADVLAVQITNPLLREIPADVQKLSDGKGGSIIIDTQSQRDKYKEIQSERQAYINQKLKTTTTRSVTVDTCSPNRAKVV